MVHITPSQHTASLQQPPHTPQQSYFPHYHYTPTPHSQTSRSPYLRSPSYTRPPSFSRSPSYTYGQVKQRPAYRRSGSSRYYKQPSTSATNKRPILHRAVSSNRKVTFPLKFIRARSPRKNSRGLSLNELLIYNNSGTFVPLEYDLSLDPSHILICHQSAHGFSKPTREHLVSQASTPTLSRFYISCKLLPWTLEIPPTHNGRYITFGDILEGLHRCLRAHASKADWEALDKDRQRRVRIAWRQRCKRQASEEERLYEDRNGLRRVDFLEKNLGFYGLTPGNSAEHWVMHVRPVKKHVKFTANS
ncbi:hypothetical protein M422DRAFT_24945 [Sphaerobolus stellatus SS14]|nr:hypothetical protein M422DRAFT_24945 [Sphaerobolus stellatus SS14]